VGFSPGGIADLMARSLGQKITEALGQQVIVDNRPGAGGIISLQIAGKAAPDGYTLLMGSSAQFSITPALRSDLPYDALRDFTPIALAGVTPAILTVKSSHPASSIQELIKLAKTRSPDASSYSSAGYGVAPQIAAEALKRVTGIEILHVPYKGGSAALTALIGGEVSMSFGGVPPALPHVRAGRLRALGVTSLQRLTATPDVPTFSESGIAGFEVVQWFGVFGPAHVPAAIVQKLNTALGQSLSSPQFKKYFAEQGVELQHATPTQFAKYVNQEFVRWGRELKELGIKAP
jgi:tripartite-type tricarboxylate transporter receptor subunit TctC